MKKMMKIWRVKSDWSEQMIQASSMEVAIRKYKRSVKIEMGTVVSKKDYEPIEVVYVGHIY